MLFPTDIPETVREVEEADSKEIDNQAGNEEVPDRPICRSDRVHNKPDLQDEGYGASAR